MIYSRLRKGLKKGQREKVQPKEVVRSNFRGTEIVVFTSIVLPILLTKLIFKGTLNPKISFESFRFYLLTNKSFCRF